jgi:hypothetical protein
MTPEELAKKEMIERLKEIANQLSDTPNCEWAEDVLEAARLLEIDYITKKFDKNGNSK